jgi:hypothetical protein
MKLTVKLPDKPSTARSAAPAVSPLLYPILLIAGISVIIASLLGIAAMTALLPQAQSRPAVTAAAAGKAIMQAHTADHLPNKAMTANPTGQRGSDAKTGAAGCADCGRVESVRTMERQGQAGVQARSPAVWLVAHRTIRLTAAMVAIRWLRGVLVQVLGQDMESGKT